MAPVPRPGRDRRRRRRRSCCCSSPSRPARCRTFARTYLRAVRGRPDARSAIYTVGTAAWCSACRRSSASSGARRSSPASSRPGRTGWLEPVRLAHALAGDEAGRHGRRRDGRRRACSSLILVWWAGSLDHAINTGQSDHGPPRRRPRIAPPLFETRGIAPIGYTAFAFALGVAVGRVARRDGARDGDHARRVRRRPDRDVGSFVREHLGPRPRRSARSPQENLRRPDGRRACRTTAFRTGRCTSCRIAVEHARRVDIANQTIDRNGTRPERAALVVRASCVPAECAPGMRDPAEVGRVLRARAGRGLPAADHAAAREPLLDAAGDRDRDLPRPRRRCWPPARSGGCVTA